MTGSVDDLVTDGREEDDRESNGDTSRESRTQVVDAGATVGKSPPPFDGLGTNGDGLAHTGRRERTVDIPGSASVRDTHPAGPRRSRRLDAPGHGPMGKSSRSWPDQSPAREII
jgi:hypothetical protein